MTDENQNQDVDLYDDENEVMEAMHGGKKMKKADEAMHGGSHDPKNAEAQSVASVDKAGDATGTAPKRKMAGGTAGDATTQDPMPKMPGTKAGIINAMYNKMNNMTKEQLSGLLNKTMSENVDQDVDTEAEATEIEYQADFSQDLNAIMENEATLSEEFKEKTAVIFEAAIKSKLAEEIDRLEATYHEALEEEVNSTKEELVEKVDSYLNYVVEGWMEENKLAVQSGLRTEIAESFMNNLKNLFTESYIEVPESKVDLVDDLAEQVEELEEKLNDTTANAIQMAEKLESYQRDAIIAEASRDLADTQVEKLKKLVAEVDFDNEETFMEKVTTVKESYFTKKASNVTESADFESDDEDNTVEVGGSMAQYLTALKSTSKRT